MNSRERLAEVLALAFANDGWDERHRFLWVNGLVDIVAETELGAALLKDAEIGRAVRRLGDIYEIDSSLTREGDLVVSVVWWPPGEDAGGIESAGPTLEAAIAGLEPRP